MDSCVRGFTISHATIDYGAFNRMNFNTAMDHLTRLLIIRGINPLFGKCFTMRTTHPLLKLKLSVLVLMKGG